MQSDSVNSVDLINDQFDEYQSELVIRERKLKTIVKFDSDDDQLLELISDIKNTVIEL